MSGNCSTVFQSNPVNENLLRNTPLVALMFMALDHDNSGKISMEELNRACLLVNRDRTNKVQNLTSYCRNEDIRKKMDPDNNGIDYGEFLNFVQGKCKDPCPYQTNPDAEVPTHWFNKDVSTVTYQDAVGEFEGLGLNAEHLVSVGFLPAIANLFIALFDNQGAGDADGTVTVQEIMNHKNIQMCMGAAQTGAPNTPAMAPNTPPPMALNTPVSHGPKHLNACNRITVQSYSEVPLIWVVYMLLDNNGDGAISTAELEQGLRDAKVTNEDLITAAKSQVDKSNDGNISEEEWLGWCSNPAEGFWTASVADMKLSDITDTDGNGSISLAEFQNKYTQLSEDGAKLFYNTLARIDSKNPELDVDDIKAGLSSGCSQLTLTGGRRVRSNKGKKRGPYGSRKRNNGNRKTNTNRHPSGRKVRSNKGKKRGPYGPRTGRTRSGKAFR